MTPITVSQGPAPVAEPADDAPITIPDALEYSHHLAQRVQREANEATALPWWFAEAAVVVFVLAIVLSSIWPMGVAS